MTSRLTAIVATVALSALVGPSPAADRPRPLKVLLLTGGTGHDHKTQKDIPKKGIEARANALVEQLHTEGHLSDRRLPILDKPDYAKGYDLVIHNVLTPGIYNADIVRSVLKPHLEDGIPAVVLRTGTISYRSGPLDERPAAQRKPDDMTWSEFTGLVVHGHGNQAPIAISFVDANNPITRHLQNWTTIPVGPGTARTIS